MPTFFNYPELYDRLIVLDGWSKAYSMTGWRLGWSVWPKKLVEHVIKFCVNNHSCVNAAIQFGGIAAFTHEWLLTQNLLTCSTSFSGHTAQPKRQPVIE